MPRRGLTTDDEKIWRYVTRHVNPFRDRAQRHPVDEISEEQAPPKAAAALSDQTPVLRSPAPRAVSSLAVGATADMDRRTAQRFKRGDMAVDGRLDLHGLTLDQAHGALTAFVRSAAARGARCVVVVTGKGKGGEPGKIRRETPAWLNQASLRSLILAVSEARPQHGGAGALYVLLKRKRA